MKKFLALFFVLAMLGTIVCHGAGFPNQQRFMYLPVKGNNMMTSLNVFYYYINGCEVVAITYVNNNLLNEVYEHRGEVNGKLNYVCYTEGPEYQRTQYGQMLPTGRMIKHYQNRSIAISPDYSYITLYNGQTFRRASGQERNAINNVSSGSNPPVQKKSSGFEKLGKNKKTTFNRCKYCNGTGKCASCKGCCDADWRNIGKMSHKYRQCPSCRGTGNCFNCHGSGRQR